MGWCYAHYIFVHRPFSDDEWGRLKSIAKIILDWCESKGMELDRAVDLEYGENIRFNGVGDQAFDSFVLYKDGGGDHTFRTWESPYNLPVGLVLIAVSRIAPDVISVASDGAWDEEWRYIRKAYREIFGVEPKYFFSEEYDLFEGESGN